MAKEKSAGKEQNAGAPAAGGNVVPMSTTCCVEKCTNKGAKMNFCGEHYTWFKEGLVNRKGQRPMDFDKKYQAYMMRSKKAA